MRISTIGFALAWSLTAFPTLASNFEDAYAKDRQAREHESLALTISLTKKSFFQGELIPVTFHFEDRADTKTYTVWGGAYDRSGRINNIGFHLDASTGTAVDPLEVYFGHGMFMGGGLGNMHELGEFSQVFFMNEWVRFDKPGTYRFYATADRVSTVKDGRGIAAPLISQIVELEIREPTDAELDEAYAKALENFQPDNHQVREGTYNAFQAIRHLDSVSSRHKLLEILSKGSGEAFGAMLGLAGSRHTQATIQMLEEGFTDPEVAITSNYMRTLWTLRKTAEYHQWKLDNPDKIANAAAPQFQQDRGHPKDWQHLLESIEHKRDRALAVSASTLFHQVEQEIRNQEWTTEQRLRGIRVVNPIAPLLDHETVLSKIRVPMTHQFHTLEPHEQKRLLEHGWDLIRCPEMAAPLRSLALDHRDQPESAPHPGACSWALQRYAELDPEAATPIILEDLRTATPYYSLNALCALPFEKVQPEIPSLMSNLLMDRSDMEKISGVLAHYAEPQVYDEIKLFYLAKEGRWACAIQENFLRYFTKVHRNEGLELAFQAMSLREHTSCYDSLPADFFRDFYGEDVEDGLTEVLRQEEEPIVMVRIAEVMKRRGSENVVQPLLEALGRLDPTQGGQDTSYDTESGAHKYLAEILLSTGLRLEAPVLRTGWETSAQWSLTPEQQQELRNNLFRPEHLELFEERFE